MAYLPIEGSTGGSDLPSPALPLRKRPTLDAVHSDIHHLYELLDVLFDEFTDLDVPNAYAAKSRISALAWIARGMAGKARDDLMNVAPAAFKVSREAAAQVRS